LEKILTSCEVSKDLLVNIISNIEYNKIIIDYYKELEKEVFGPKKDIITKKIEYIRDCNKYWDIDKYKIQKVKDFKRTNLCKDKFCSNCKKVKQSARMTKYLPELEKYKNISYHLTLTAPTVKGEDLKDRINLMAQSFRKLINYISGKKRIKGVDFEWGYKGAIRSLEVTFKDNIFHPHYHCLLLLDSLQMSDKVIKNDYSYSYGEYKHSFSEEEILIQKMWYLLINKKTVNKKNIDSLNIGYSCKLDKLQPNDYNELFKYMIKEIQEDGQLLTYNQFKTLYFALYRVKQIQGYGILYNVTDDGDIQSVIDEYNNIIEKLKEIESPERILEKPSELLKDKEYILISRKSYFKYLRELEED